MGKAMVAAFIRQLTDKHKLGYATEVLLTGDSAGGVGIMNNADYIRRIMEPQTPGLKV